MVEHLVRSSNHNMQREEAINFADGTEIRSDVHEPLEGIEGFALQLGLT